MWNDLLDLLYEAYEQFSLLPLFIEIALVLIIVAVLATILAYLVILVKRYRGYVYQKRLSYLSPKIEDLITEQVLLNENLDKNVPIDEIEFDKAAINNKLYKKPAVRQILIDVLIRYRKNFRGEVGDLLRKLYIDMNLLDDSFKKLNTFKWENKIKAIVELTQMDIPISDSTLLPLTNSRNPTLRAASTGYSFLQKLLLKCQRMA